LHCNYLLTIQNIKFPYLDNNSLDKDCEVKEENYILSSLLEAIQTLCTSFDFSSLVFVFGLMFSLLFTWTHTKDFLKNMVLIRHILKNDNVKSPYFYNRF